MVYNGMVKKAPTPKDIAKRTFFYKKSRHIYNHVITHCGNSSVVSLVLTRISA